MNKRPSLRVNNPLNEKGLNWGIWKGSGREETVAPPTPDGGIHAPEAMAGQRRSGYQPELEEK